MSEDDTQRTVESEARGAEHRENLALTDARRAEEEVAKAHAEAEAAEAKEEKLSRKERRLREKAERVHAEADRMRAQADADRARAEADAANTGTVSGARVASPGVGSTERPRCRGRRRRRHGRAPVPRRRQAAGGRPAARGDGGSRVRGLLPRRPHPQADLRLSHG